MAYEADFEAFWRAYPRKVSKLAAKKAYEKARRSGASQSDLLNGIAAYIQHKPAYADFCHASTWLTAGRWMDEWEAVVERRERMYWADECAIMHGGTCEKQWTHEMKKRESA